MDYQEAIETIQYASAFNSENSRLTKALDVAISAMQELQIYKENEKRNLSRTDRLMDECAYRHENGNCLKVGGFCTSVPLSHCQRYKDWYTEYRGYKKIGTLEEIVEYKRFYDDIAPKTENELTDLVEYRKIGTIDEIKVAVEKKNKKKPTYDGDGYAFDGTFVWDEWLCPNCGTRYEVDYDDYDYCPNCGQHIDWSEVE